MSTILGGASSIKISKGYSALGALSYTKIRSSE